MNSAEDFKVVDLANPAGMENKARVTELQTPRFKKYRRLIQRTFFGISLLALGHTTAFAPDASKFTQEKPPLPILGNPLPIPDGKAELVLPDKDITTNSLIPSENSEPSSELPATTELTLGDTTAFAPDLSKFTQEKPPLPILSNPLPIPDDRTEPELPDENISINSVIPSETSELNSEVPATTGENAVEDENHAMSDFRLPFDGKWQITQGPSVRTINGEVCDSTEHTTHQGLARYSIDFLMPEGIPILASQSGEVIYAGWKPDYGDVVLIQHADGLVTWYGHLSQMNVKVGDEIEKGYFIGQSGKTGTYQSHLHWELRDDTNSSVSLYGVPGLVFYGGPEESCSYAERFEGEGKHPSNWNPPVHEGLQNPTELAQATAAASTPP